MSFKMRDLFHPVGRFPDIGSRDRASGGQNTDHGRRLLTDTEIDGQDQAEMNAVDPKLVGEGQKDWHQHQDCRCSVDDCTRQKEEHVDRSEDHPIIVRDSKDGFGNFLGNALVDQIPPQQR